MSAAVRGRPRPIVRDVAVDGTLVAALGEVVGAAHVLVDADLRAPYEVDWSGRRFGDCAAVVRPGTASEVSLVLRRCRAAGVPVVVQGGNTGLVGGGVPGGGEVVLSTRRPP